MHQSMSVMESYWCMDKSSMPEIPAEMRPAIVSEETLLARGVMPGAIDWQTKWLLDQVVDRASLPIGTQQVQLKLGSTNTYRPAAEDAPASSSQDQNNK